MFTILIINIFYMDKDFFKQTRILDGGMGQELLARGMKPKGSLWSASALLNENYHDLLLNAHLDFLFLAFSFAIFFLLIAISH